MKKAISLVLTIAIVCSMVPAFAAEVQPDDDFVPNVLKVDDESLNDTHLEVKEDVELSKETLPSEFAPDTPEISIVEDILPEKVESIETDSPEIPETMPSTNIESPSCNDLRDEDIEDAIIQDEDMSRADVDTALEGEASAVQDDTQHMDEKTTEQPELIADGPLTNFSNELKWRMYSDGTFVLFRDGDLVFNNEKWREFSATAKAVVIEPDVIRLPSHVFSSFSEIESIYFPDTITSIPERFLSWCRKLTDVRLPNTLKSIGVGAFSDCTSLRELTLPESTNYIADYAFSGCQDLTININNDTSVISASNAPNLFDQALGIMVKVPINLYVAYKTDPAWSAYNVMIEANPNSMVELMTNCRHGQILAVGSLSGEGTAFYPGETVTVTAQMEDNCIFNGWVSSDITFSDATARSTTFVMPSTSPTISVDSERILGSGTIGDGITWAVNESHVLAIDGEGVIPSWGGSNPVPWSDLKNEISSLVISGHILDIGEGSFSGCGALVSATLPESIETIGVSAFSGCRNLAEINWPSNLQKVERDAFRDCISLTVLDPPDSIREIGAEAFYGCTNIALASLPQNITYIGDFAFFHCEKVTISSLPRNLTYLGELAFSGCSGITELNLQEIPQECGSGVFSGSGIVTLTLGTGVHTIPEWMFADTPLESVAWSNELASIGNNAFSNCVNLNIEFWPSKLTSLGAETFSGCVSMKMANLPREITTIPNGCFSGCNGIETLIIPYAVLNIGDNAFLNCNGLKTVQYCASGGDPQRIGNCAFKGCTSLTTVELPATLQTMGSEAFFGCTELASVSFPTTGVLSELSERAFAGCTALRQIDLPNNLNSIGWYCFENCTSLNCEIPNRVAIIGTCAFYNCTSLSLKQLPDSITHIGAAAFYNCTQLQLSSLPASLKYLDQSAFENCRQISINYLPDKLEHIGAVCFGNCTGITSVTIPDTMDPTVISKASSAFAGCTQLREVVFPSTVTELPQDMFQNCTDLTVELPAPNVVLGMYYAFRDAKSATIYVPYSLLESYRAIKDIPSCEFRSGHPGDHTVTISSRDNDAYVSDIHGAKTIYFTPGDTVAISTIKVGMLNGLRSGFVEWTSDDVEFEDSTSASTTFIMPDKDITVTAIYKDLLGYGTCGDNISWTLDRQGDLTLVGYGPMSYTSVPWSYDRRAIKRVFIDPRITTIGASAFADCLALTSVNVLGGAENALSTNITEIGRYAFDGDHLFSISSLPNGITSISDGTFRGCDMASLKTIPASVQTIGKYAFSGTNFAGNLQTGVTTIKEGAFASTKIEWVSLPGTVTDVGAAAFANCTKLRLSSLPSKLKSIGSRTFSDCKLLSLRDLPGGITYIGASAFENCPGLRITKLPSAVKQIDRRAFYNSNGVTLTVLPQGLTYIGDDAFLTMDNTTDWPTYTNRLNVMTIPQTLRHVGSSAFMGCSDLQLTELPDGITYIGAQAFKDCRSLELQTLPSNLTTIGTGAFSGCWMLAIKQIPNSVQTIGEYAFEDCKGLTKVTIPANVSSLQTGTFRNNSDLTDITLLRTVSIVKIPDTDTITAFDNSRNYRVHVPAALLDAYSEDPNWDTAVFFQRRVRLFSIESFPIQINCEHGTVTAQGEFNGKASEFWARENIDLKAQPDEGYQFVRWDVEDAYVTYPNSTTTTLAMPAQAVTITAVFQKKTKDIVAVAELENVKVKYNTSADKLNLPQLVSVTLEDGTTKDDVPVVWDTSNYDMKKENEEQYIQGELTLREGIENPKNLKAQVKVVVQEKHDQEIVEIEEREIETWQSFLLAPTDREHSLGVFPSVEILPETVWVKLANGGTEELSVVWDTGTYDPTVAGPIPKPFTGEVIIPPDSGITNPDEIKAKLYITVMPKEYLVVASEEVSIEVLLGTDIAGLNTALKRDGKNELDVWAVESENLDDAYIFCDIEIMEDQGDAYDMNTPGTYSLTASMPENFLNFETELNETLVSVTVLDPAEIVKAEANMDYYQSAAWQDLDNIPTQATLTLDNGHTTTSDVEWDWSTLDKDQVGEQIVLGTLVNMPVAAKQPEAQEIKATMVVNVVPMQYEVTGISGNAFTGSAGLTLEELNAILTPSVTLSITSTTEGVDFSTEYPISVMLQEGVSGFDPEYAQEYTFAGLFELPDNIVWPETVANEIHLTTTPVQIIAIDPLHGVAAEGKEFNELELPTQVTATLSCIGVDGKNKKVVLDIDWGTGEGYVPVPEEWNEDGTATLTVTGTIANCPQYISNAEEMPPVIQITMTPAPNLKLITPARIPQVAAVEVKLGSTLEDIYAALDTHSVQLTMEDYQGNQTQIEMTFTLRAEDNQHYDPMTQGTYTLNAYLPLGNVIKNPDGIQLQVVVKAVQYTIFSIRSASLIHTSGTAFADLDLPEQVTITRNDKKTEELDVTWSEENYNPTKIGNQIIQGALVTPLPVHLTNPNNRQPKALLKIVNPDAQILSLTPVKDEPAPMGMYSMHRAEDAVEQVVDDEFTEYRFWAELQHKDGTVSVEMISIFVEKTESEDDF